MNAHIEKVSEQALLEQQAVSETREEGTDYMQDGPTEVPGDVVPAYRSNQAPLEQQAVSETRKEGTDYMQDGPTEAPGDVVPEYRSNQALLEQQAVSETREDGTDYMQDGPTEAPGDVVPEYRSKQTRYGITSTYAIGKSKAYSARLSDRYSIKTACVAWYSVV